MGDRSLSKTRRLALMAVLTAIALGIFMLEAQLPSPVPIPGVKLGLANIITLTAMLILGRREAGVILLLRIVMGAMFAGSPSTLIFSAMGGVFAYLCMCLLTRFIPEERLWATSAVSAVAHNAGQLLASILVLRTPGLLVYAPVLAVSGVITGVFTGVAAKYLVRALRRLRL
ncbi:MAG: Gx transporter family protein [Oscillospiraceae bacterium]|nr:Gx transporter family protein [Oscillospiraceae bacterium]